MLPYTRSFAPRLALLLLGLLIPAFIQAQTAVVNLNFDNPGDRFANTGAAGTTFSAAYDTGPVTFGSGIGGGTAAIFDGNSSLQASDTPLTTALTVSFWMNTTSTAGSGPQWYNGNGLVDGELSGDTTDWGVSQIGTQVAFGIGSSDTTIFSTSSVNTGNWIHVAATWDTSGTMNLYLNGSLEATYDTGSSDPRDTSNQFFVGQDSNGTFYTGSLDEIQIYDSALSSGQITALAAIPEPATYAIFAGCGALGLALWRRRRAK
jgi:hypothetical protein